MRKSTRQELRKLRELVRVLLEGKCCFFCKKVLLVDGQVWIGNADGSPLQSRLTWHHIDGEHDNNERANLRLSHTDCHKSYHMRKLHRDGHFKRARNKRVHGISKNQS